MKLIIIFFLVVIIFFSCSQEEPAKMEAFSTQAFAFDLGDTWEVNASTRVKGFKQTEEENKFFAALTYDIDLVIPEGDTLKSLISRVQEKEDTERINEIPLETQFELDSTYSIGEYKIIFNIKDPGTELTATSAVSFSLSDE
ncbi:MAG: hypothetical protein EHM47_13450 [Ignavibacteriales bacterium]|nr:MAG: hypothetical protein EHM47_13450 [Ignavibacteriales bacterium]